MAIVARRENTRGRAFGFVALLVSIASLPMLFVHYYRFQMLDRWPYYAALACVPLTYFIANLVSRFVGRGRTVEVAAVAIVGALALIATSPAIAISIVSFANALFDQSEPVHRELTVTDTGWSEDDPGTNFIITFTDYRDPSASMSLRVIEEPYPDVSSGVLSLDTCDGALGLPWACGQ